MELKSCIVFEPATPKGSPPNKELKFEIFPISFNMAITVEFVSMVTRYIKAHRRLCTAFNIGFNSSDCNLYTKTLKNAI